MYYDFFKITRTVNETSQYISKAEGEDVRNILCNYNVLVVKAKLLGRTSFVQHRIDSGDTIPTPQPTGNLFLGEIEKFVPGYAVITEEYAKRISLCQIVILVFDHHRVFSFYGITYLPRSSPCRWL